MKILFGCKAFPVNHFFQLAESIKLFYDNQRIKTKLIIIHLLIVFFVCSASLLAFNIILGIYEDILYNEASQVLNLSTVTIENDLKRAEKLSYNVISDPSIQEYAQKIKNSLSEYEVYTNTDYLIQKLQALAFSENYITGVVFIDKNGNQTASGMEPFVMKQEAKDKVIAKAAELEGGNFFTNHFEGGPSVLSVRQLRSTNNLSLEPLGTIVFRINLKKLMERYASFLPKYEVNLLILSEGNVVYMSDIFTKIDQKGLKFESASDYRIENLDGKNMFISYTTSQYTKWVYAHVIPYENIFNKVIILRNVIIGVFILLFISISMVSMLMARSLTKPIEKLSARMKRVETGNFELEETDTQDSRRMDEIGHLHKDFEIMVKEINTLIKENYTKQIVIKDTQIKALQAQINPHFLYNTLESINWLAKVNKQRDISMMVESLGTLLRSALSSKETVIYLAEESCLLESYINIQKTRYEERLDFSMDIGDCFRECRIPKLTLQPIVENSIHYGLENMMDVCRIRVKTVPENGNLNIVIEDNGPGIESQILDGIRAGEVKPKGFGIGLKNIDDRIKLIFGEKFGVSIESEIGKGTRVSIKIPCEVRSENV